MRAYDLRGPRVEKVVTDLEARAWQHEIDHLNGVLFIDKMGLLGKVRRRKPGRMRDFEYEFRQAPRNAARSPAKPTSSNC